MRPNRLALLLTLAMPLCMAAEPDPPAAAHPAVPACQACHISPNPNSAAPHIAGQRVGYLAKQLAAFKRVERKDDVMNAVAGQLSDGDITALAQYWAQQPAGSDAVVPPDVAAFKRSRMPFPADFPKDYAVYRVENDADSLTVSRSWANDTAMNAARLNQPLPDGSVIIVASYKARLDAAGKPLTNADGTWQTDDAQSYSGMEARAGWGEPIPALLRNANWHYNLFAGDRTPNATLNQAACLACHKPAADRSFVFTLKMLQDAAQAPVKRRQ